MRGARQTRLGEVLLTHKEELLKDWLREQLSAVTLREDLISEADLQRESTEFLGLLGTAVSTGDVERLSGPAWDSLRDLLADITETRTRLGFAPAETATFVFSLKQPLFERLFTAVKDPDQLRKELWTATVLLDKLGLYTAEVHARTREEIIQRQQRDLLELSTPVVKLWEGILALPLIGTLDSERTQVVMESLLQRIVETGAEVAIIDITGVPIVDTLVAQHLLKTVAAARLMGADCIISGIRPQIAQTIVHLGVDLSDVVTRTNLAEAFRLALERTGQTGGAAPRLSEA